MTHLPIITESQLHTLIEIRDEIATTDLLSDSSLVRLHSLIHAIEATYHKLADLMEEAARATDEASLEAEAAELERQLDEAINRDQEKAG